MTDPSDEAVNLRVPFTAPSASVVRHELRNWLSERGFVGEMVEDARVVVSELVGNSVRHGGPLATTNDLHVSWSLDENDLVISVRDGGNSASTPEVVHADESAVSGRGLSIVEALTQRWWVDDEQGATTVHVRIPLV